MIWPVWHRLCGAGADMRETDTWECPACVGNGKIHGAYVLERAHVLEMEAIRTALGWVVPEREWHPYEMA
jgi:hypothetical protein